MIPNAGLDNCAEYPPFNSLAGTGLSGNGADASGTQWLAFAAISEDSSAPDPTDTNIGSEAMRTNSTGGFNRSSTAIRDGGTNRLGLQIERAYVFTISSNLNITKYGYVPLSAGGNFSWIDLTRVDPNDPGSTPVTLTLEPDDELQLWQTLTITVPWSVDLESFVVTGTAGNDAAGTHDAYCGFFAVGSAMDGANDTNSASITNLIRFLFWPTGVRNAVATPQTPNAARDAALAATTTGASQSNDATLEAYAGGGVAYRDKLFEFTTAQGNLTITGIVLTAASGLLVSATNGYGFKIVFDDPSTFVKDNLHKLILTFRVSWAEG